MRRRRTHFTMQSALSRHISRPGCPLSDYELIHPPADRDKQRSVLRSTLLLALAFLVGPPGAYIALSAPEVSYTAEGRLWIEGASRQGSNVVTPIRGAGPPEPNAWIELLRSYQVLEAVVVDHNLYLRSPEEHARAFATFSVADQFLPGAYRLRVGAAGEDFVLVTGEGALVQQGSFGTPIGKNVGFAWEPMRGSFAPGATVEFSILSVRDAARDLSARLTTIMDREGDFLSLRLIGPDRQATVDVLNSLMEQYVGIAAELKISKLNEVVAILEEQLHTTVVELARAKQELEEFLDFTMTLPLAAGLTIAPGLEMRRNSVFGSFFDQKVQIEQIRRDRVRLQVALDGFAAGPVRTEVLEVIQAAATSSELRRILDELMDARSELRALRDLYADDYPPIQDLLVQLLTIETRAIPRVVQGIINELSTRENEMQGYVGRAAAELAEIPLRTIEEGRLRRRVATTKALYDDVRGRLETDRLAAASSIPDVRILDRASVTQ